MYFRNRPEYLELKSVLIVITPNHLIAAYTYN